jgi:hypothetical protein
MTLNRLVTALSAGVVMAVAGVSFAQDTQYWTQHYGTRGELLQGTVVGSIIDLSSVYYNPGTLALQRNPSFILGTKAFELQTIRFEDVESDVQEPLVSRSFRPAPTIFAGIFPPRWLDGQLAYSMLTRSDFDFRLQLAGSGTFEPDYADSIVSAGGEVYLDQDITGVWGGPTWSRAWGKMGVGVTGYVAYQGQRSRSQLVLQGLRPSGEGASATFIDNIDYWHFRLVFKAGVAWDYRPLTFGIAVTAPGIGLFGQGSSLIDYFSVGVDLDKDGTRDTELIANYFTDQPADYRSPGSIAGGVSYRYKNTTVHASAEYFGSVDEYEVLPTQVFTSPTTGKEYTRSTTLALDDVFNWGIGVEQHIRDWLTAYGSFITDNSAYLPGTGTTVAVSNWDLKHIMGGTAFSFLGNDITLGVGYAWGSERLPGIPYVQRGGEQVGAPIFDVDALLKFSRWKIIIGFAFGTTTDGSGD